MILLSILVVFFLFLLLSLHLDDVVTRKNYYEGGCPWYLDIGALASYIVTISLGASFLVLLVKFLWSIS